MRGHMNIRTLFFPTATLAVLVLFLPGFSPVFAQPEIPVVDAMPAEPQKIILTMTIERMSIVWEERGGWETFKETLGTILVAVCGFYVMNHYLLEHLMFNFPELLLVLLSVCLLFGNYTGYRVSELLRFRDLSVGKP